jgi:hypothetical protein
MDAVSSERGCLPSSFTWGATRRARWARLFDDVAISSTGRAKSSYGVLLSFNHMASPQTAIRRERLSTTAVTNLVQLGTIECAAHSWSIPWLASLIQPLQELESVSMSASISRTVPGSPRPPLQQLCLLSLPVVQASVDEQRAYFHFHVSES